MVADSDAKIDSNDLFYPQNWGLRGQKRSKTMMTPTHLAIAVAGTSLLLGTANPLALIIGALGSTLPDIDTSKSTIGRIFFPISHFIEQHLPHRSITHSFLATGIFTLVTYPITFVAKPLYWQALVLGYFFGWFADVFTKSGVAAFYPSDSAVDCC